MSTSDIDGEGMEASDDDEPADVTAVKISRETTPFNEFLENDRLLHSSFPFLFVFGRGVSTTGSLSREATRHMLLQFSSRFADCHRFIFLLFDQFQRHAASKVVASRAKCNPKSFEDFVNWLNEQDFVENLKKAAKNPAAPSSIALLKKLSPHIQSCSSRIPLQVLKGAQLFET